jgi:hypothetical protein
MYRFGLSKRWKISHLTTLRDRNVLYWLALWVCNSPCVLDLRDDVHALYDIAKDDVLAVQMRCPVFGGDDEELAAVCLHSLRLSFLGVCENSR